MGGPQKTVQLSLLDTEIPICPSGFFRKSYSKNCVHAQSHSCLCDPLDCSLPGSSVHGIFQARILEWVDCHFLLQGIFPTQGWNPSTSSLAGTDLGNIGQ